MWKWQLFFSKRTLPPIPRGSVERCSEEILTDVARVEFGFETKKKEEKEIILKLKTKNQGHLIENLTFTFSYFGLIKENSHLKNYTKYTNECPLNQESKTKT